MSTTGSGTTSYAFTGEWTDGSGLVYLRARYYDPEISRFGTADVWDGNPIEPMSFNKWLYSNNNPIIYRDPSGYNPSCTEDVQECAKMRLDEIIAKVAPNGAEALFRTFEDWELEGLWGDAAGTTSSDRLEWLLDITTGVKDNKAQNALAPVIHAQFAIYFGSDCGFAVEFRDSQFYDYWYPDGNHSPSNQVGHFLSAVGITYWEIIMLSPNPADTIGNMATVLAALATMIGHEKVADRNIFYQQPFSVTTRDFELWREAVEYDGQGLYFQRDEALWEILNFNPNELDYVPGYGGYDPE